MAHFVSVLTKSLDFGGIVIVVSMNTSFANSDGEIPSLLEPGVFGAKNGLAFGSTPDAAAVLKGFVAPPLLWPNHPPLSLLVLPMEGL
jgi:hypothetical protein